MRIRKVETRSGRGSVFRERNLVGQVDYSLTVNQEDLSFLGPRGVVDWLGQRVILGILRNWSCDLDEALLDPDEKLTLQLDNHLIQIDFQLLDEGSGQIESVGDFYRNPDIPKARREIFKPFPDVDPELPVS